MNNDDNSEDPASESIEVEHHIAGAAKQLRRRTKPNPVEPEPSPQEVQHFLQAAHEASISPEELKDRLSNLVEQLGGLPEDVPPVS